MTGKWKRYSAESKAKVALEWMVAPLVAKPEIYQTLINAWKTPALDAIAGVFSGQTEIAETARAGEGEKRHAMMGPLVAGPTHDRTTILGCENSSR